MHYIGCERRIANRERERGRMKIPTAWCRPGPASNDIPQEVLKCHRELTKNSINCVWCHNVLRDMITRLCVCVCVRANSSQNISSKFNKLPPFVYYYFIHRNRRLWRLQHIVIHNVAITNTRRTIRCRRTNRIPAEVVRWFGCVSVCDAGRWRRRREKHWLHCGKGNWMQAIMRE